MFMFDSDEPRETDTVGKLFPTTTWKFFQALIPNKCNQMVNLLHVSHSTGPLNDLCYFERRVVVVITHYMSFTH